MSTNDFRLSLGHCNICLSNINANKCLRNADLRDLLTALIGVIENGGLKWVCMDGKS